MGKNSPRTLSLRNQSLYQIKATNSVPLVYRIGSFFCIRFIITRLHLTMPFPYFVDEKITCFQQA